MCAALAGQVWGRGSPPELRPGVERTPKAQGKMALPRMTTGKRSWASKPSRCPLRPSVTGCKARPRSLVCSAVSHRCIPQRGRREPGGTQTGALPHTARESHLIRSGDTAFRTCPPGLGKGDGLGGSGWRMPSWGAACQRQRALVSFSLFPAGRGNACRGRRSENINHEQTHCKREGFLLPPPPPKMGKALQPRLCVFHKT